MGSLRELAVSQELAQPPRKLAPLKDSFRIARIASILSLPRDLKQFRFQAIELQRLCS